MDSALTLFQANAPKQRRAGIAFVWHTQSALHKYTIGTVAD